MEKDNTYIVTDEKLGFNMASNTKRTYIGVIVTLVAIVLGLTAGCVYLGLQHQIYQHHISKGIQSYKVNVHNPDGTTVREVIDEDRENGFEIHHVSNQAILTHHKLGINVMRLTVEKMCFIRELIDEKNKKRRDREDKDNEGVIDVTVDEVREYNYVKSDRPVNMAALGDAIGEFCKGTEISWVERTNEGDEQAQEIPPGIAHEFLSER
ncbi:unnamed protein product [Owenia fusiformis]|uniref:Uncharacterized protein n=1 Tax=Owenia fusiformis TaxID=6347 RepID=A0A8J1XZG8_OWEFU|nr:unnamed protein product [Owenia fusiformis]